LPDTRTHIFRTMIFTLLVPGVVAALVPYLLLQAENHLEASVKGPGMLGLVLVTAGVLVYLRCALDFIRKGFGTPSPSHPPSALVISGLYRFTRNPMYVGVGMILVGEALLFGSLRLLVYSAFLLVGFHWRIVNYEEPTLRQAFGEAYERYCQSVPRWILPRLTGTPGPRRKDPLDPTATK